VRLGPGLKRTALSAAVGVGVAGLLAGVLVLGAWGSLLLLAIVFALVWPAAHVVRAVSTESPYGPPVLVALIAAGGVLCLPGLVRLLSWGATGFLFALAMASVAVVADLLTRNRRPRRRSREIRQYADLPRRMRPGGEGSDAGVSSAGGSSPRADGRAQNPMSVAELCRVWRESGVALRNTTDVHDRETVAEVRRLCLDELERRNPDGFRRWIDAGAPADPGAYLLPGKD